MVMEYVADGNLREKMGNLKRSKRFEVDKATDIVKDWSGATRIGRCLKQFNRTWSRRVLGQGAITLIISDGLDRDEAEGLEKEMERLAKSTRRLIWLNPLLRYEGFEPKHHGCEGDFPTCR